MSQTLSRCAGVQPVVKIPQLKCDQTILGDFGNLSDFGRAIGSVPGQLGNIAYCVGDDLRRQIETAIENFNKALDRVWKTVSSTVPSPVFKDLKVPELENEIKTKNLWQEFKLFFQKKLVEIVKNIPGLSFITNLLNVPIPFLTGVRLFDVFTEEGRKKIRDAVGKRTDQISKAIGGPWQDVYDGKLSINAPEIKKEFVLDRIFSEIEKLLTKVLWNTLGIIWSLTAPIRRIWNALGLPSLPSFKAPNFDEVYKSVWDKVKDQAISAEEKMQKTKDALLNFDLKKFLQSTFGSILSRIPWPFGTKVKEMLKVVDKDYNLKSPEIDYAKTTSAIQKLFDRIPGLIFELWLSLIRPFLTAIRNLLAGVVELLKYIPFTFCTFLNLVAAPLLGFGAGLSRLLPAGVSVQTVS